VAAHEWRNRSAQSSRSEHVSGGTRCAANSGEGAHALRRCDHRRSPSSPDGRGGPQHPVDGPERPGDASRCVRRPTATDAYYFMWHTGHPASEQCEGCTWVTTQVRELSYLHSRDVTFAVFCQGPYEESARYRAFMGWEMPWYSALGSLETLLVGRRIGRMHIVCYLRQESKVFETYWTTARGVEVMDNSYHLLDLTVFGRQEAWEDSPAGWPRQCTYTRTSTGSPTWQPEWPGGRPIAQWPRLEAGRSDDLGATPRHGK
jgi:hypothetical protein